MFNIYLPHWITLATIEYYSEKMWAHLIKHESVPLVNFRQELDLSLTFLYKQSPGLVFVSNHYSGEIAELGSICAENGHVPFRDDAVLTPDGVFESCLVVPAINALIDRCAEIQRQHARTPRSVVDVDLSKRSAWRKRLGLK